MTENTLAIQDQNRKLQLCLQILRATGARINEVLSLTWEDTSETGHIFLQGSKGSGSRIAHAGEAAEYIISQRKNRKGKILELSYMYVYRYLRAKGLYEYHGDNVNASVTHVFRHKVAKQFKSKADNKEAVKSLLNHKSTKSTEVYVSKKSRQQSK